MYVAGFSPFAYEMLNAASAWGSHDEFSYFHRWSA